MWLTIDNIQEKDETEISEPSEVPNMVGSGVSVGAVVSDTVGASSASQVTNYYIFKSTYSFSLLINICSCNASHPVANVNFFMQVMEILVSILQLLEKYLHLLRKMWVLGIEANKLQLMLLPLCIMILTFAQTRCRWVFVALLIAHYFWVRLRFWTICWKSGCFPVL